MAVISLSHRDNRVERQIHASLPGQEVLAKYLTDRLADLGGNERVANLILIGFASIKDPHQVTEEGVARLGVDAYKEQITRLMRWYGEDLDTEMTALSLRLHVVVGPKDEENIPRGISRGSIPDFIQLFVCAYAMLTGVEFDPREELAA